MMSSENMATPKVISDPSSVTVDWLNQVLAYQNLEGDIVSFDAQRVGTGQLGYCVRFTLEYAQACTAPNSVVIKFPAQDPTSRETARVFGVYRCEFNFYTKLQSRLSVSSPHCLFAGFDADTEDFCIVMSDMAPAVQGDQISGCSIDEARAAVHQLAGLHGPSWSNSLLQSADWLPQQRTETEEHAELYKQLLPQFVQRYHERMDSAHIALAQQFGEHIEKWIKTYQGPLCISHGDYRLDNLLFDGPHKATVVDWQTMGISAPAMDLSYFVGAGLNSENRRRCERELIRHYLDELQGHGVSAYSEEDCWNHYRHYAFYGLSGAITASMSVQQTERGDEMFITMASRHAQQALDLDSLALIAPAC